MYIVVGLRASFAVHDNLSVLARELEIFAAWLRFRLQGYVW